MGARVRLFGRHEIDDWRDRWTLVAAKALNDVAADLIGSADAAIARASTRQIFASPGGFIATRVAPRVRAVCEPVVADLFSMANQELARIADHQAVWARQAHADPAPPPAFEGARDLALAAGPTAGGVAIAAALPTAAITTTTAWFGLVATTTVSWPVVVVGGTAAGAALAFGLHNSFRLRDRFEGRLRKKARDYIGQALLKGTRKHPAVLEQVSSCLTEAADRAKGR